MFLSSASSGKSTQLGISSLFYLDKYKYVQITSILEYNLNYNSRIKIWTFWKLT